jgi:hypothetical protein
MPRLSRCRNEVAMQCEARVIHISTCCIIPGPQIQPPHHLALPLSLLASPAVLRLFIAITMVKDSFKFHSLQVSLSCNLLSRIPTLVVHIHATKACMGSDGTAPHILQVGTRWIRVPSLTPPGNTPRNAVDVMENRSLTLKGIRTMDRPTRSPVIVLSSPCN